MELINIACRKVTRLLYKYYIALTTLLLMLIMKLHRNNAKFIYNII